MPILKGLMSYQRFKLEINHKLDHSLFLERLNLFRFKPLKEQADDYETFGWVPYLWEYDEDKKIDEGDFLYDQRLIFCLRIDNIKLPRELIKNNTKKSIKNYYQQFNKWPDKVTKKEIEANEIRSLRAKMIPKTKIIEAILCLNKKEIRIFSKGSSHLDKFLEIFEQSFSLKLTRIDFAWYSLNSQSIKTDFNSLLALHPAPLFQPALRTHIN